MSPKHRVRFVLLLIWTSLSSSQEQSARLTEVETRIACMEEMADELVDSQLQNSCNLTDMRAEMSGLQSTISDLGEQVAALTAYMNAVPRCPQDYTHLSGFSCFSLISISSPMSYTEAEQHCSIRDGHLAIIDSAEKSAAVFAYVQRHGVQLGLHSRYIWIGLKDDVVEGVFRWTATDRPVEWTNWGSGQPDDAGSSEDCVGLVESLGWNDYPCGGLPGYDSTPLCERAILEGDV